MIAEGQISQGGALRKRWYLDWAWQGKHALSRQNRAQLYLFFFFSRMEKTGWSGEGGFRLEPTVGEEPGKKVY